MNMPADTGSSQGEAHARLRAEAEGARRTSSAAIAHRIAGLDWQAVETGLDEQGCATVAGLLDEDECDGLAAGYADDDRYRSRIVMARHGFGRGEYKYFRYPLPGLIQELRSAIYPRLAPLANRWNELLGMEARYPAAHAAFIERCHAAGQRRPTPLILRYGADDYNCLHQDLYGAHVFPVQATILLSEPETDFSGGEFVMTEQGSRGAARPQVVPLRKGDAVVFAVNARPVQGRRGARRVHMRHGVSRLLSGRRYTVGLIFHDAA